MKHQHTLHSFNNGGEYNMTSIREQAESYEEKTTKNISDLNKVSIDLETSEESFTKSDGEKFTINLAEIDGNKYRVPVSVLKSLKILLKAEPDMKYFKVIKSGEGMSTSYTVVPVE